MNRTTGILVILSIIGYCELMWWIVKRNPATIKEIMGVVKMVIYINIFLSFLGQSISQFINIYFMTLYYFVIYRERGNELQSNNKKGTTI
ncbi:hypothetical protein KAR91_43410 [Candidatus Pacearchaeota archaeon]|nr:hypothetical protein [Candidatus Pacearchaeota archaeon]